MGPPKASNLPFVDGSVALGVRANKQFSTLYSSKMENFFKIFFDVLTIHNDEISYVKHDLDPFCVFFTPFGCFGGGVQRGLGHNLLMQFSSLGSSKMLTIQNDQISHVKHILDPLYVIKYPM